MKKLHAAAALAVVGSSAIAGGIDRSGQSISTLFEPGALMEFSLGFVSPNVSGTVGSGTVSSGDAAKDYLLWSFAYKRPLNESFDLALIIDQPFGADIDYKDGTFYPLSGSYAKLRSTAVTGLVRYRFSERLSAHGGVRLQTMTGEAAVSLIPGYTLDANADLGIGYALGFAYEIPDIALRAALTYNSPISHDVDATETGPGPIAGDSTFGLTTPRSVNFDFQTGIAEDTLLMASVRWVDWSAFDITPPGYQLATGGSSLVSYDDDRYSYTLGVGRRFNDQWSGSVTLGYEAPSGGLSSNLSPTDGYKSIAFGAAYTQGNMKVSGGLRYIAIGDTTTSTVNGDFSDNSGWAAGLKVSYAF